jgi:hypothetical protein
MPMYGRTVVNPDSIRSASVLATITTVPFGLGWLLGAGWSVIASSARITPGSSDPATQGGARQRSRAVDWTGTQ